MKREIKSYHKVHLLLAIAILAMIHTTDLYSQTCRIKIATLDNGNSVYTEVYESGYVDIQPEFPGGEFSLMRFINSTREYPQEAYAEGVEGRVTCSFVVLPDGKIDFIRVLKGVTPALDDEAVRIISKMPNWIPGKKDNHPVPVRVIYGIPFRR